MARPQQSQWERVHPLCLSEKHKFSIFDLFPYFFASLFPFLPLSSNFLTQHFLNFSVLPSLSFSAFLSFFTPYGFRLFHPVFFYFAIFLLPSYLSTFLNTFLPYNSPFFNFFPSFLISLLTCFCTVPFCFWFPYFLHFFAF